MRRRQGPGHDHASSARTVRLGLRPGDGRDGRGDRLLHVSSSAPIIFRVLGAEAGGRFVRALFPRYYLWNAILGSIALPAFVAGPLCFPEYRGISVGIESLILLAIILTMLYGGNSLVPQINRARDLGPG